MSATTYDILIEQGATYSQVVTYKEGALQLTSRATPQGCKCGPRWNRQRH
jgi:hypothetical protein